MLGLEICFRDPGVGKYGLHNALFAMSGTFLEVVSPLKEDTAAGRYIERRKGDGGYMYIVDCDDLERRREVIKGAGVRLVEDLKSTEGTLDGRGASPASARHGRLPAVGRSAFAGWRDMMAGSYKWAGEDWQEHDRSKTVRAISGRAPCSAMIRRPLPSAGASCWSGRSGTWRRRRGRSSSTMPARAFGRAGG